MSLRRENTAPSRVFHGASSMRLPRTLTPPQQRAERQVSRRGSLALGHLQYSADKKPPYSRRNSFSCANDELSPNKLDFQSLKKRPSLLGGKLKSGSSRDTDGGGSSEKHSIVMLGAGGVGKTGIRDAVCTKVQTAFKCNLVISSVSAFSIVRFFCLSPTRRGSRFMQHLRRINRLPQIIPCRA